MPPAPQDLPIAAILPALLAALAEGRNVVLLAPPGSGKTTLVPPALLDAAWRGDRRILMLEPRRLAARAAATRMAALRGEAPGGLIGYRTRLDSAVSAATRIEVLTEGLLLRRLLADPLLDATAVVILDEIHERSVESDLALALLRDLQRSLRPDLRLIAMSATLESARLATLLDATVIESAGRPYPVTVAHAARDLAAPRDLPDAMAAAIRAALAAHPGDILAFLPGMAEIRRTEAALAGLPAADLPIHVLPLHGDLAQTVQDAALTPAPGGARRVVLATAIAETSLTVPGVRIVIDGGFRRAPRLDPGSGLARLVTTRVSRASAEQRAGRAGREAPGVAIRLWTAAQQRGLAAFDRPEILEAELSPLRLACAVWTDALGTEAADLPFPDPPPAGAFAAAGSLLADLGALEPGGRITAHGQRMAALGAHPRLAAMMLAAATPGEAALAATLAALLEERDPLRTQGSGPPGRGAPGRGAPGRGAASGAAPPADIALRLEALGVPPPGPIPPGTRERNAPLPLRAAPREACGPAGNPERPAPLPHGASARGAASPRPASERAPAPPAPDFDLDRATLGRIRRAADRYRRRLDLPGSVIPAGDPGRLIAAAFPDRIAARRDEPGSFRLAGGGGARLPPTDPLARAPLLAVAALQVTTGARIRLAAPLDPADLPPVLAARVSEQVETAFDPVSGAVLARRRRRLGALVLSDTTAAADPAEAAAALAAALAGTGRAGSGGAGAAGAGADRAVPAIRDAGAADRSVRRPVDPPVTGTPAIEVRSTDAPPTAPSPIARSPVAPFPIPPPGGTPPVGFGPSAPRAVDAATPSPGAIRPGAIGPTATGRSAAMWEKLPWSNPARQLQARVALLRGLEPDAGWPDLGDPALRAAAGTWLAPHLTGLRRLADLARLDLAAILRNALPRPLAARLDRLLPEHLALPHGRAAIDYTAPVPTAAARAQAFYGLRETPRLADGRVALSLALLSPAGRPVAITGDLVHFWRHGWPELRKSMRGRYPRHDWPERPDAA